MMAQKLRKVCYQALIQSGYSSPQLFFDRKVQKGYSSYWGDGEKRMEVLYDKILKTVSIFELRYIS